MPTRTLLPLGRHAHRSGVSSGDCTTVVRSATAERTALSSLSWRSSWLDSRSRSITCERTVASAAFCAADLDDASSMSKTWACCDLSAASQ